MKIAFVCPFYHPVVGGPKQVVEELAKRYVKDGHEVHVFTSDWDRNKRINNLEEVVEGVHVHRCRYWFTLGKYTSVWPSVFFKLMKGNFDVIHSHVSGHAHQFFAALAAKLKRIKHVHTTHSPWIEGSYRPILSRIFAWFSYRTFMKLSYKWTDTIVAITPWELSKIKKYGGDEKKTIVIENGTDEIFLKKVKKNNFKRRHRIKGSLVLFFGRLDHVKGPDKFVHAAKKILKEWNGVDFAMVGPDGGLGLVIKSMIKGTKIKWLGPIYDKKEIARMYQAAEVYVLPSYREGLPLSLLEAMASGVPVVASPVNGVPYVMKEGENGFFADFGDVDGLADGILKILTNDKLARKMSANNKKKAKDYTWDVRAKKYMNVYNKVNK